MHLLVVQSIMKSRAQNSNIDMETAVAVEHSRFMYGSATGVSLPQPVSLPVPSHELITHLRFLSGEVLGICFVIFSTFYIFAMPSALTKPGWLKAFGKSIVKRTLDIVGAIAGLIIFLPVWLIVPILIKLDSPGPVLYSQIRVGVNRRRRDRRFVHRVENVEQRREERRKEDFFGKPFRVLKFRTMVQDAEKLSGPVWATKDDERITRLGRVLRKARLDEAPQFFNVLKGDMSLVGPRPERPNFVRDLSAKVDDYSDRLSVKPGLTGLAQIENGYDSSVDSVTEKVRFDLHYIRNWSIWSDMKILAKTVVVVVTGKGAC